MKEVHLIVLGKLKDQHLEALEAEYLKRITTPGLKIIEVKASAENKDIEAEEALKKIREIEKGNPYIVLLEEKGKVFESPAFSEWVSNLIEREGSKLFFVIGGAEGHGEAIRKVAKEKLSLSLLTFPHKLARLLFVEQFYRAQTIKNKHPYHK